MIFLQPDLSLLANLNRLAVLVKDWPGEPIDPAATIFALNPEASATPVYWCFNTAAEFMLLGKVFGADQPLVGMRSLNQIVKVTQETTLALDLLAKHYADSLLARFGERACIVGGNCQAAGIAWRVASHLRLAGVPVQRLVLLDAEPHLPYPDSIRLLFGARSTAFNPYLKPPADPLRRVPWHWERAWHRFETRIVPGGHGEYFTPENLPEVAKAILDPLESHCVLSEMQRRSRAACRSVRCKTVHVAETASTVEIIAGANFEDIHGLAVVPLWHGPDGSLQRVSTADWVVSVDTLPIWRGRFPAPAGLSGARLVPVLCMAGFGPLVWPAGVL
ncbi:hypothetical protein [Cypionkella sp.]|uniref:hypothetical protein n=1 Tax=Cypionkella sp. TaxID=2811411 RepID=UPI0026253566|nr:hypothetical protein [Cypionkella sp.]MDB5663801.1 hypothetical protein [Cypionkella sp.]